jgi:hypothetical protein
VRLSSLVKTCAGEYDCSIGPQIRDAITNHIIAAIKKETADACSSSSNLMTKMMFGSRLKHTTKVKQALRDAAKMPLVSKHRLSGIGLNWSLLVLRNILVYSRFDTAVLGQCGYSMPKLLERP